MKINSHKSEPYQRAADTLLQVSKVSLIVSAVALTALAASVWASAIVLSQLAAVVLTASLGVSLISIAAAGSYLSAADKSRKEPYISLDPIDYSPWDQTPSGPLGIAPSSPSAAPIVSAAVSASLSHDPSSTVLSSPPLVWASEPPVLLKDVHSLLETIFSRVQGVSAPAAATHLSAMSLAQSIAIGPPAPISADRYADWNFVGDAADPEEDWSFPEAFASFWRTAFSTVRDRVFPDSSEPALRVKASKYEALMRTINNSLKAQGLPERGLPQVASYTTAYLDQIRRVYEDTLTFLRVTNDPKLNKVCFDLYTTNSMVAENDGMLAAFGVTPTSSTSSVVDKLEQANKTLKTLPSNMTTHPINRWARSAKDWLSLLFSPLNAGNPPQLMNRLQFGGKTLDILGMGSPTVQGWDPKVADIDPIFIKYLQYLRVIGKKHFYVSNQNARDPGEQVRNAKIMELQKDYPDVFIAITCTKNSTFYHGKVEESMDPFKLSLYNKFFVDSVTQSGCYLPDRLRNDKTFQDCARTLINKIQEHYFPANHTLTEEERHFFIEMFYTLLVLAIADLVGASYLNFTCKDGIDRGMGSLAWLLALLLIVQQEENTAKAEKVLFHTFFTRCFWTRKRPIIEERFMSVIHNIKILNKLDPDKSKTLSLLSLFPKLPILQ